MARGDGYEVTRVVDEAGQVIKAGRLADRIEVAVDAVSAVVEPPGRPQQYRGVVAGERSELAAVRTLIKSGEDESQARVVAVGGEERLQSARPIERNRDVGADIRAKALL